MPTIKNRSAYGDLDVPLLRRTVEAGAEVDVTEAQATVLLAQVDNWGPVGDHAEQIAASLTAELEGENSDEPPAKNAKHEVWIGYALKQGDDDAASKSRQELIEQYGETS